MMNLRGNNGLEGRATELFNGLLRLTNEPTMTTIGETKFGYRAKVRTAFDSARTSSLVEPFASLPLPSASFSR